MIQKDTFLAKKKSKNGDCFGLNYWEIFDIRLFGRGMSQVLKTIDGWLAAKAKNKPTSLKLRRPRWVATVNPEFVMKTIRDNNFKELLTKTDLNVVDGVGLIWAKELGVRSLMLDRRNFIKKILIGVKVGGEILRGKHKEGLVTGVDLMGELVKLAGKKKYKVFFLGGFGDRAEKTAMYFKSKFLISNFQFGWCAGEPKFDNDQVLEKINKFKPDILLVAYGMKKQEEWIYQNLNKLDVGVVMGVGRSFDYYSGDLKRAPEIWRKMGMEWLYSLIKEPKRFKRQLELPKFVWKVLKD